MNATVQRSLNSSPQLKPMPKPITTWHLTGETPLTGNHNSSNSYAESHRVHINSVCEVVKDTGGYFHGGLND
jgi:hypothetical protein